MHLCLRRLYLWATVMMIYLVKGQTTVDKMDMGGTDPERATAWNPGLDLTNLSSKNIFEYSQCLGFNPNVHNPNYLPSDARS